jgi:LmbE family N-acetylglucosaminyl deacetylase
VSLVDRNAPAAQLDGVGRVVVVAPHPDDEVLGSGLLLTRAAELGLEVRVLAVTDGEAAYPGDDPRQLANTRSSEQLAAIAELGVPAASLRRIGVPDGAIGDHLARVTAAIRREVGSDTLLVAPTIHDWHPDHVACGIAAARAATWSRGPLWSSLFWAHHHPARLTASRPRMIRFDGKPHHVAARAQAIRCHQSQFRRADQPILTAQSIRHLDSPVEMYVEERR